MSAKTDLLRPVVRQRPCLPLSGCPGRWMSGKADMRFTIGLSRDRLLHAWR
jgi:hypothetical protein